MCGPWYIVMHLYDSCLTHLWSLTSLDNEFPKVMSVIVATLNFGNIKRKKQEKNTGMEERRSEKIEKRDEWVHVVGNKINAL